MTYKKHNKGKAPSSLFVFFFKKGQGSEYIWTLAKLTFFYHLPCLKYRIAPLYIKTTYHQNIRGKVTAQTE